MAQFCPEFVNFCPRRPWWSLAGDTLTEGLLDALYLGEPHDDEVIAVVAHHLSDRLAACDDGRRRSIP
jgi:hypothetical protein